MVVLAVFGTHAGFILTRFHVVFLQGALAGLVADGAVQRVVHQHEFLRGLAGVFDAGARSRGVNFHTRGHRRIAGDHQHATAGAFLLHQALAAVSRNREERVVTYVGRFDTHGLEGFEKIRIARNHHRLVVHEDFHLRAVLGREFRHVVVVTHIITRKFQDDRFLEHGAWRGRDSLRCIRQSHHGT